MTRPSEEEWQEWLIPGQHASKERLPAKEQWVVEDFSCTRLEHVRASLLYPDQVLVGLAESWHRSLGKGGWGKANRGQGGCHVPRLTCFYKWVGDPGWPSDGATHHGEACQEGGEAAERDDKNSEAATHFPRCWSPLSLSLDCVHFLSIVAVSMNLKAWFQRHKCSA